MSEYCLEIYYDENLQEYRRRQKGNAGNKPEGTADETAPYERNVSERLEHRQRRMKRQCQVLGVIAALLLGAVTIQAVRKNHSYESAVQNRAITQAGEQENKAVSRVYEAGDEERLLVLVNKTHMLSEDYQVNLHVLENGSCAVAEEMYDALRDMLTDGSTEGREFVVASGYRSREVQQQLLDEDIEADMQNEGMTWEEAYEKETRETMPPGYSEHETGLAVDIVALDYQILDAWQENTPENIWLRSNCSKYGFILRYPKGSEEITQIDYESWHFRYVGREAAEEITRRGITLEEYLEQLDS